MSVVPIIDLFARPGGLGEGFSTLRTEIETAESLGSPPFVTLNGAALTPMKALRLPLVASYPTRIREIKRDIAVGEAL
jgi:hypothetical protein